MIRRTTYRARVGYVDTDQAGVVHHSTYFRWFEQARVELLREGGLVYGSWETATRLALPVVDTYVRYLLPTRFDDVVCVETWVGAASRAAVRFDSRVTVEGRPDVTTEAQVRLACVDLAAGPRRIPDEVLVACFGAEFESHLVSSLKTRPGR